MIAKINMHTKLYVLSCQKVIGINIFFDFVALKFQFFPTNSDTYIRFFLRLYLWVREKFKAVKFTEVQFWLCAMFLNLVFLRLPCRYIKLNSFYFKSYCILG